MNAAPTDAANASVPEPESAGAPKTSSDFELRPESSPWTTAEKIKRVVWMLVGRPFFRITFHNWYGVRRAILRTFGAKVAHGVRVRPSANIEIPWHLDLRESCVVGDHAILYSLGMITIGERAIISQYAHLCAGTHDYTQPSFQLIRPPVTIGHDAWIAADAFVGPGVTVGPRAILGARASAFKDLDADMIYAGNPAKAIRPRDADA